MLTDTHCHLDFDTFAADRQSVIERALQAGVERMLNPAIDLPTARAAIALSAAYPQVFAAVGIHPNSATLWEDGETAKTAESASGGTLEALRRLAAAPKVIAIGEIGLDYYRDKAPKALQRRVLQAQLELAAALGLPVVIHCRDAAGDRRAAADTLDILADWLAGDTRPHRAHPGVLHSFLGELADAERAVALGFYIGITGPVTFRSAAELQRPAAVAAALPLEALLIETDAPFLTPHPHRGKRNEPAHVRWIAEKIAGLHGVALEKVATVTTQNADTLFDWRS